MNPGVSRTCMREVLIPVYVVYEPMALRSPTRPPREGSAAIPTRFSAPEVGRIDNVRRLLGSSSRSAFIRDAVLEKVRAVEESKIVEIRNVTEAQAIRMMDRYLQRHPGVHHVDEIADELGVELRIAFAAAQKLLDRGWARVREG